MYYVFVENQLFHVFQEYKRAEDYCLLNAERYGWEDWHIQGERKEILKSSKETDKNP